MTVTKADTSYASPGSYYYLWHLISLGVLDAQFGTSPGASADLGSPTITNTVWDKLKAALPTATPAPATVALIDVGVSHTHPNLKGRLDTARSIDLVTHRYGAQTVSSAAAHPYVAEVRRAFFDDLDTADLDTLDLEALDATAPGAKAWFKDLAEELRASKGVVRTLLDTDDVFGSHGTGIAGLVVGEPALTSTASGTSSASTSNIIDGTTGIIPADTHGVIPYFGVDPLSKLISIRSSFGPDPAHFASAFLYAWKCGADVILLPRGLPDTTEARARKHKFEPGDDNELEVFRNSPERATLLKRLKQPLEGGELIPNAVAPVAKSDLGWEVLAALMVAISKKVPIICAAGNEGESQLIYPANLAAADNGIIAVGAVSSKGYRSGYSNYGEHLTLVAPSDDGEVYNRHQLRIDRTNPLVGLHAYVAEQEKTIPYSPLSLLTTDVPGTFGYAEGVDPIASVFPPLPGATEGVGGYYAPFGGTSGASALVAGVAALVARAHKAKQGSPDARLDGKAMKEMLVGACNIDGVVLQGGAPLTPDPMNADAEPDLNAKSYFFGAGLLSASDALEAALA